MANRYWVGGSGTWNGGSTANWSTLSGGSPGASVPLATDNVFFDALSGGGTVTVLDNAPGNPPECANLTCTGFTGSIDSTSVGLNVNGNVTLSTGGDYTLLSLIIVSPTVCTLTSVGNAIFGLSADLGATVTLADDLNFPNFSFGIGTFTTNNFNVVADTTFIVGTLNMGSSTFTVNGGSWYADPLSTINAGTSTINMSGTTGDFDGGDKTYYNLNIGANLNLTGDNTFNTISNSAQPITIRFDGGSTTTVTNFNVSGTAGNLVLLTRFNSNNRFILSKASGTVSVDYLQIQRSNATGGAAWYAGANSNNLGLNLGWIFTAPPGGTPIVISEGVTISGGVASPNTQQITSYTAASSVTAGESLSVAVSTMGFNTGDRVYWQSTGTTANSTGSAVVTNTLGIIGSANLSITTSGSDNGTFNVFILNSQVSGSILKQLGPISFLAG